MATINNFVGFETGGTEETSTVTGPVTIQSGTVRTGTFAAQLDANAFLAIAPFEDVADAGDDQIVGFAIRFTDTTPLLSTLIFRALESTGTALRLRLLTNGDLALRDANDVQVGLATNPFTVDTWHYVEVRWQHLNSGAADVFIDGVSAISVTAQDFDDGSGLNNYQFANSSGSGITSFVDDVYMLSGAAGTGDFLGTTTEVLGAYQKTDGGATDLGDTLDVGTWALASETPGDDTAGNTAEYTGTPLSGAMDCNSGTRAGPSGDPAVTGTLHAAKWIYTLRRSAGGPTTHEIRYGNSGDGLTNRTVSLTTSLATFVKVSEAATEVPLTTETFQIGMAVTGPRIIRLGDAWAMLLHTPAAAVDLDELGAHQII